MAEEIFAVVADHVIDTGTVSFIFMFDSGASWKEIRRFKPFGHLQLKDKSENHIDPFRLAQGLPGAIGPDGFQRWNLNVFEGGKGLVAGIGVDEDKADETPLGEALRDKIPDCILLMDQHAYERLTVACAGVGVMLISHHYDGDLRTS